MSVRTPRIDAIDTRNDRLEKNYIINGDMRIAQRGTSFAAAASDTYSLDRWVYRKNGTMVHTLSQDTDVPTFAQAGYLFQNSYRANLTTAQTSIGAGNFALIRQRIEGYNWANLAQKPFCISFWVKATLPGIYYVNAINSIGDQCFAAPYTINSASTWEYKTVSITASPSAGTWNYTNGNGLVVDFTLACGSNFFSGTPGSWVVNQSFAGSNQINGVNTGATDFRITGVSVVEGTTNTKFSTFARSFQGELQACERYFRVLTSAMGKAVNTTRVDIPVTLSPSMRATPVLLNNGSAIQVTDFVSADFNQSSANTVNENMTASGGRFQLNNFTGLTTGASYGLEADAAGRVWLDAEI